MVAYLRQDAMVYVLVCFICWDKIGIHFGLCTEIRILPEKDVIYSEIGSNVTVICAVTELDGKPVRWSHDGKQIAIDAPENTVVFVDPADRLKYNIEGAGRDGGNFSFTLLNFTKEDLGPVTCDVSDVDPLSISLDVFVEPESIELSIDSPHTKLSWTDSLKKVRLSNKSPGTISCTVTRALPIPNITWTVNGLYPENLNISEDAELSDDLYNFTSYLTIPSDFARFFALVSTQSPPQSLPVGEDMTAVSVSTSHPATSETALNTEIFAVMLTITCEVLVGDKKYADSVTVEISNLQTSGASIPWTNWIITFMIPVISALHPIYILV